MTPTIEQFMTPTPKTIGADQTLEVAADMMRELGVRHLPVRASGARESGAREGKLVGVVSARDLERADAARDSRRLYTPVSEVMRTNPWCVAPETPLADVVREMAERKVGSVVIASGDCVVGIFTGVDAARVLADLVEAVERSGAAAT